MDKKRILIVDDESHIGLTLSRLLSKDYVIFEQVLKMLNEKLTSERIFWPEPFSLYGRPENL